jgi:predicted transcriptional regulator
MMSDAREITDLQLMILNSLWHRREASVRDVHGDVAKRAPASRKTVATLLARLEARGMVRHRLEGREGLYRATVTRRKVLVSRVGSLLGAMFDSGRVPAPGSAAVDSRDVREGDVARIISLLKQAERDLKSK